MSSDPLGDVAQRREDLSRAHEDLRQSDAYQREAARLRAIMLAFVQTVSASWLASTRDPAQGNWVFWRFTDDIIGSAVAIASVVSEGVDTVARRELRFVLELLIRNLYVDTVVASRETPLETRMAYVQHKLGSDDLNLLPELRLNFVVPNPEDLRHETKRLYGDLSDFVHPSHRQMARRLALSDRGVFLGFETETELHDFNDLFLRACDVFLALVFEALGPSSTGDLFVGVFDDLEDWVFARTPFVSAVSATFDYKLERQERDKPTSRLP